MRVPARVPSDIWAALLLVGFGAAAVTGSLAFQAGSLTHMGPAFFPRAIGIITIALGVLVGIGANAGTKIVLRPSWEDVRGWVCILGGIIAFVLLGPHGGLMPASFAIVFLSALASQRNSLRDALLLAIVMTIISVVVFGLILKIQIPLIGWSR